MSEELTVVERDQPLALERPHPREIIKMATEEAEVLASVIEKQNLYSMIQGRKFVKVEGWTTLATLRGCLPREVSVVEMPEGRYVATVELIRMNDGMVLTRASAECGGPDDYVWTSRPPNARRSMAITRATGKACRIAFSWVMALAGFDPTPLEEMPEQEAPAPKKASENAAVREAAKASDLEHDFSMPYGKHVGEMMSTCDSGYLKWFMGKLEESIKDPAKATYKASNKKQLDSCLAEISRRAQNAVATGVDPESLPF